jgi:hypothetical protein
MVMIKPKVITAEQRRVRFIVIKEAIRNNVREARWSKEVRAKAGNRCAECGAVHELTAHHIKPLRELVVEHNIETPEQALTCDALFDVANGVCLCPTCHAKRHPENVR